MSDSQPDFDVDDSGTDTDLAALTHVLALLTSALGPLIVYMMADDEFVKENAANALNWQIMCIIYSFISGLLFIVVVGIVLLPIVLLLNFIFCIMAAMKAMEGETWDYPLTPDFI